MHNNGAEYHALEQSRENVMKPDRLQGISAVDIQAHVRFQIHETSASQYAKTTAHDRQARNHDHGCDELGCKYQLDWIDGHRS